MEQKTQLHAEEGRQDLLITRTFDLPLELLFKAYTDAELFAQWMTTKVLKLDMRPHGGYQFETSDDKGNVVFKANGTIHECLENKRIVRTFEMENTGYPVQLEFLEFESRGEGQSALRMQIVYRSVADRDQMLKLPFRYGLNMAHDRIQELMQTHTSK